MFYTADQRRDYEAEIGRLHMRIAALEAQRMDDNAQIIRLGAVVSWLEDQITALGFATQPLVLALRVFVCGFLFAHLAAFGTGRRCA